MFTSLQACSDDEEQYVPVVSVNIELNVYRELASLGVGTSLIIEPDTTNENYGRVVYPNSKERFSIPWKVWGNGILLYRENFNTYRAYDRTCPYRAYEDHCALKFKDNILVPECPCCGSKFMLTFDGSAASGSKAVRPLVMYRAVLANNNTRLLISN